LEKRVSPSLGPWLRTSGGQEVGPTSDQHTIIARIVSNLVMTVYWLCNSCVIGSRPPSRRFPETHHVPAAAPPPQGWRRPTGPGNRLRAKAVGFPAAFSFSCGKPRPARCETQRVERALQRSVRGRGAWRGGRNRGWRRDVEKRAWTCHSRMFGIAAGDGSSLLWTWEESQCNASC